jgi:ADP-ribosylglycohydrolase
MRFVLTDETRGQFAADSLAGLSVGDALGAQYFMVGRTVEDLLAGEVPEPVWEWTDDTEMACSVVWMLHEAGRIDPDRLAAAFADRCEPYRGYGAGAFVILHDIRSGTPWAVAAAEVFDGQGSCGNGAAMRVAPLGAYFAGSPDKAVTEAEASAKVTHAHPEGVAGAIAVAVAACHAVSARLAGQRPSSSRFLEAVAASTPDGVVKRGLHRARRLPSVSVAEAAYELGNGSQITAQDTVPFTIWVAARHLDDYPAAVLSCIEAGGDVDTTAAIVGGIVGAFVGQPGIPPDWLAAREPLPDWLP